MFQHPLAGLRNTGRVFAYGNGSGGWIMTGDSWSGNSSGSGNLDFGDPVRAAGNGVVVFAADYGEGWGKVVVIQHKTAEGVVFASTTYALMNTIEVALGTTVAQGQVVGSIGNGGDPTVTDAHLSYSVYAGALTAPGAQFTHDLETSGYVRPDSYTGSRLNGVVVFGRDSGVDRDDVGRSAIVGPDGPDILSGLGGNDWIEGRWGNDFLDGGTGNDTMLGGLGDDVYVVDSADDVVDEATSRGSGIDAEGTDTVRSAVSWTLDNFVENLVLTGAASNGTGNTLSNLVMGNNAGNTLKGGDGSDRLNGLGGKDTVDGGQGDDTLGGGAGNDVLIGGEGADVYFFDTALSAANVDLLVGFDAAVDKIYLDHTVFVQLGPEGALSSGAFDITGTLSLSQHIHIDAAAQKLYFDPGSSSSEIQFASFQGLVGTLTHENFRIV